MMELNRIEAELREIRRMLAIALAPRLPPKGVTQTQAAEMLACSPKTVGRMVRRGDLVQRRIGSTAMLRIPVAEIRRLLDAPSMRTSGASEEQVRFDGEAAMRKLKKLRARGFDETQFRADVRRARGLKKDK